MAFPVADGRSQSGCQGGRVTWQLLGTGANVWCEVWERRERFLFPSVVLEALLTRTLLLLLDGKPPTFIHMGP